MLNPARLKFLNQKNYTGGAVVYWMSRDQRVHDNWALLAAQQKALQYHVPLIVVFNLVEKFLDAGKQKFLFMLNGLQQVEAELQRLNIPFHLLIGEPHQKIPPFVQKNQCGLIVTDFDPLRIKKKWRQQVSEKLDIPMWMVDAHNIIPVWETSNKQEYAAYTIRPKIHKKLDEFIDVFPAVQKHPFGKAQNIIVWENIFTHIQGKKSINTLMDCGEKSALKTLADFIDNRLDQYEALRNDPTVDAPSNLSPYLHFGQISAQRIALAVRKAEIAPEYKSAFLEELIVRRELSDNFCYYNENYDNFAGFPNWARQTLTEHHNDPRPYLYSYRDFENAETHDALWNAAQQQMVKTGKMHSYMRMYWAKKILEWTPTAGYALKIAIQLNDTFSLDGCDPNGYCGIAWSIGGVHDRAWFQRPIFGKVRYMSENGCRKKFKVDEYIRKINLV